MKHRPLRDSERAALQARTARAVRSLWAFKHLPVQVGSPCQICSGLYWLVTGKQEIAPTGYCLNCHPAILEKRPALLRLIQESMLDLQDEEENGIPAPDVHLF
jgi:hypothetical protein